jgi:2-methylcitrate dehydratase PrpD
VLDALVDALGAAPRSGDYPPWTIPSRPAEEQFRRVRVWVAERSTVLAVTNRPNQLSAKFSIPYATAAFLVRGSSDPDSFRDGTLTDGRVRALAERVEVIGSSALSARWPEEAAAQVELELMDGRVLTGMCSNPYGSADHGALHDDLHAKFRALTADVLSPGEQNGIWARGLALEDIDDVAAFPSERD